MLGPPSSAAPGGSARGIAPMAEKGARSQSGDRVSLADPIPTLAESLLTCVD